jgi:hypothetical protein
MKHIAVLSVIGFLGMPIQAQAQSSNAATVAEFERKQQELGQALSALADMRYQMLKEVAEKLRVEPEQNAPPTTQYYAPQAAPTTQYSDPGLEVQRQAIINRSLIDFNRAQTQTTIDLMHSMNRH